MLTTPTSIYHFTHIFGYVLILIQFLSCLFCLLDHRNPSQDSTSTTFSDDGYTLKSDVHHQYFTVAIDFLKDIISESSVVSLQ